MKCPKRQPERRERVVVALSAATGFLFLLTISQGQAGAVQYGFDAMERLTRVTHADGTSIDCVYDALGNRLMKTTTLPGGGNPIPGWPLTVIWTVSNSGSATARSTWADAVYFSTNAVLDVPPDTPLRSQSRSLALAAGGSYRVTRSLRPANHAPCGRERRPSNRVAGRRASPAIRRAHRRPRGSCCVVGGGPHQRSAHAVSRQLARPPGRPSNIVLPREGGEGIAALSRDFHR
jgi:YD repeat-containing protein